ncbi:alpha/beta hydrolase [Jatrophihabitans endophyticus]|uniref:alpha/beta hydrolase n=1 Tax=Jatrophihabitans endophyticus TaxID=1206085 RepID=UPI0019DA3E80|nr:alpha/beta hydrolase [Jatrophihabitans endophyticus]MBE7189847.1 alpha/beta hydrolase [Jatrophihabitans endophyticus]
MRVTKSMIDPQLRRPGAVLQRLLGTQRSVEALRKPEPKLAAQLAPLLTNRSGVSEVAAHRPDGSELRMLVFRPAHRRPDAPALLWIHGGGYAGGTPDFEQGSVKALMDLTGCVVLSPDYRLSRDAPYPAAAEDCYTALLWLRDNATALGAADDQIVVAGASAGGGLTAAVTLMARDRGEVQIAFQCPLYPMIDDRPTGSSTDNDAPVWDQVTNQNAWRIYLGPLDGDDVPSYAAPARETSLAGLPPTITFVGDIEAFRDETVEYVEGLRAAKVPTEFLILPGAWHGFDRLVPWARVSKQAQRWFQSRFVEFTARYRAAQTPTPTPGPRSRRPAAREPR